MTKRQYLRLVDTRLHQAQEFASKSVALDSELIKSIISARAANREELEPLLVHCGQWEPLNEEEEILYDKLQFVLRFDDKEWANITDEQRFSAARVIMHNGGPNRIKHPVSGGSALGDYIGIAFPNIFIGIEKDGYAHS